VNEIEEVRQMIKDAQLDGHLERVALKIFCAYASNPAMMPPQDATLETLRRLAIDQAKAFLADLHPGAPEPLRPPQEIRGIKIRILQAANETPPNDTSEIVWTPIDTITLAEGDTETRKYVIRTLEEMLFSGIPYRIELNDMNESGPWILDDPAALANIGSWNDAAILTEWIKRKHQEAKGR
jgi:hypothetical protein